MRERVIKGLSVILSVMICCWTLASCCGGSTDGAPQTENTSAETEVVE